MNRQIGLLIFLIVFSTACTLLSASPEQNESNEELTITIKDATERGFPVYLPSNNVLQSMEIANSPTVTLNRQDRSCSFLLINFYYEDKNEEEPAIIIQVSDGCAFPFWRGYEIELSWAEGGKATLVEEDKVTPIITFEERTQQFRYVIFSEEPLSNTLKLLESMN